MPGNMVSELTKVQHQLLDKIAQEYKLVDWIVEDHSQSSKGENYMSRLLTLTIKDKEKFLDIVVKMAPSQAEFRKSFPVQVVFQTEIYVYKTVLPAFSNFQEEMGVQNPFRGFAKMYGTCEEEFSESLILENLVSSGFSVWNRRKMMTTDHIALVMSEYGKLHAVSLAMKQKNKKRFENLSNDFKEKLKIWNGARTNEFLKNVSRTITQAIKGNVILEEAFQRIMVNVDKYFLEELQKDEDKMVITHGDGWCNNMLFKYEDLNNPERPTKVCLIDWQVSKYALPLTDVAYFFTVSTSKETLRDYKTYLKIYHESLSNSLREMSCDPEKIFPFEDLEMLWKKFGIYSLFIGGFVFKVLYVENDKAPEPLKNTNSLQEFLKQFDKHVDEEKIKERIVDLFSYLLENDFV